MLMTSGARMRPKERDRLLNTMLTHWKIISPPVTRRAAQRVRLEMHDGEQAVRAEEEHEPEKHAQERVGRAGDGGQPVDFFQVAHADGLVDADDRTGRHGHGQDLADAQVLPGHAHRVDGMIRDAADEQHVQQVDGGIQDMLQEHGQHQRDQTDLAGIMRAGPPIAQKKFAHNGINQEIALGGVFKKRGLTQDCITPFSFRL